MTSHRDATNLGREALEQPGERNMHLALRNVDKGSRSLNIVKIESLSLTCTEYNRQSS